MDPQQIFSDKLRVSKPRETKANQGLSRAWIRCPSGRRLDLLDPSPIDVEITDIALSLSRISRWAGMTNTPFGFSVAQHCVLVVNIMEWMYNTRTKTRKTVEKSGMTRRQWLLAGLCHDGPESYLGGDLCGPAKAALRSDGYKALEDRLERAIHISIGLPAVLPAEIKKTIKEADRASAYAEAVLVAGFTKKEAYPLFGIQTPLADDAVLVTLSPPESEAAFLGLYAKLTPQKDISL